MKVTGITSIDHSAQTAAEWLNEICDRLGWADNRRAYLLLRTVLHGLRDWMTVDEAADLSAQLPVLIRGIYFEGWDPSATPVHPRTKKDFVERVEAAFNKEPLADPDAAVAAVFAMLDKHVSRGEVDQVRKAMRKEIRELWPQ